MLRRPCLFGWIAWVLAVAVSSNDTKQTEVINIGVDDAWPTHYADNHHHKGYKQFLQGCAAASGQDCGPSEEKRLKMNREQPPLQTNFTETGYMQTKLSSFANVLQFWKDHEDTEVTEGWTRGEVFSNHWIEKPPAVVDINQWSERASVMQQVRGILEQWTGRELLPVSVRGITSHHTGAIVPPHVDG